MTKLTTSVIESLKGSGKTKSEPVGLGGSLLARGLRNKTRYYYGYRHKGEKERYPFGDHNRNGDSQGSDTSTEYSLVGARARAITLAALQQEHGDLIGYMREQQETAAEAIQSAGEARITRQQETRNYSLENLCKAYWKHLETEGKASARDVRNGLRLWVIKKQPSLAKRKASEVTTENVLTILRAIIEEGHTTQTNRVRSYLSAAYTFGLGSATDPLASSGAGGFRLTSNPVAPVKRVTKFERAGERTLSGDELGELLRRLNSKKYSAAKAITLSIRLGGQRITQLLAATTSDYDRDNSTITLRDPKGRRSQPRKHLLPIPSTAIPLIIEALANPHPIRKGLYNGLTMETASKLVREISKEMETKGSEPYSWRDLRRTCETMLASLGISKDLRAQIQSHGLSGVQERHYDKYQYINEKRIALESWNTRLDELIANKKAADNVVQISR